MPKNFKVSTLLLTCAQHCPFKTFVLIFTLPLYNKCLSEQLMILGVACHIHFSDSMSDTHLILFVFVILLQELMHLPDKDLDIVLSAFVNLWYISNRQAM